MENPTDKLRQVVEEYWRKEIPTAIERKIVLKTESDHINDIIGPRRAGKTYLMFSTIRALLDEGLEKEATIYIHFRFNLKVNRVRIKLSVDRQTFNNNSPAIKLCRIFIVQRLYSATRISC